MEGSPFAPICNELAAEFDTAEDTNNIEMTKELLDKAKKILANHDSPEYAPLFYVVGTSSTIERNDLLHNSTDDNPYMDEKVLESQKNVIIELTIAIRIEERQRNRDGMKIIKQSLNEYLDEYKV